MSSILQLRSHFGCNGYNIITWGSAHFEIIGLKMIATCTGKAVKG